MKYYLTIDVGGTEIKVNVIDENDCFYFEDVHSFPAQSDGNKDEIINNISEIIINMIQKISGSDKKIAGIGFAFPGPFDYQNNICLIQGLSKYENLYGVNVKEAIETVLQESSVKAYLHPATKMAFENDGVLFALGEAAFGQGVGHDKIACFAFGTGCGSTFLEKHAVVAGRNGVPVRGMIYDAPFKDSIIDDYLSARGLKQQTAQFYDVLLTGKELYELSMTGDKTAQKVFENFGRDIESALWPFLEGFSPNVVIFGGQISKSYEFFKAGFSEKFEQKCIRISENTSKSTMYGIYTLLKNGSKPVLDHTKGAKPLYDQVKNVIKMKITEGTYPVNAQLPTEKELENIFNVSRITIRKAMEELLNEGYIARQRGSGTVVLRQSKIEEDINSDRSFTDELRANGIVPGTQYLKLRTVIAGGTIAESLGIENGTKVLELTRVRTADGVPIVIFQTYINLGIVTVNETELKTTESLYALLENKGYPVTLSKEVFEVALSNEWNSQLLEIPLGTPLLKRASIVHAHAKPLLYTESTYNGHIYRYTVTHR